MKDIYKEEDVTNLAEKVLSKTRDVLKNEIADGLYYELESYLYEHYRNNKEKIENELIKSITEEYVKSPNEYKFGDLREKMFNENKEVIVKTLTDEAIQKSVEDVIEQYTHRDYTFDWKWKDGIARFIIENFSKFENDERVNSVFIRQYNQQKAVIKDLEERLERLSDIIK